MAVCVPFVTLGLIFGKRTQNVTWCWLPTLFSLHSSKGCPVSLEIKLHRPIPATTRKEPTVYVGVGGALIGFCQEFDCIVWESICEGNKLYSVVLFTGSLKTICNQVNHSLCKWEKSRKPSSFKENSRREGWILDTFPRLTYVSYFILYFIL